MALNGFNNRLELDELAIAIDRGSGFVTVAQRQANAQFNLGLTSGTAASGPGLGASGNAITPGTVLASAVVIVDASKNAQGFGILQGTTLQAGLSGTAGTLSSFPTTAAKGKLVVAAVANTGNTTTTISNAAMGQASTILIPDPGAATSNFVLSPNTEVSYMTPSDVVIKLTGVNFNSANTDNAVTIALPSGYTRYMVDSIAITHASASLTTATIGLFTGTGGAGTVIANSAITVSATADGTANNAQSFSGPATTAYTLAGFATMQVRIGTAEGSAATGDVSLRIRPLP